MVRLVDFDSNQAGTFESSNPPISINGSGNLSLGVDLSGSVTQSGETIDSTITFTNGFSTTTTQTYKCICYCKSSPKCIIYITKFKSKYKFSNNEYKFGFCIDNGYRE